MRVMRTVYVTEHTARLRVRKANLVVERARQSDRVPIETIEAVVLIGRAEVTNDAMGELARRGVRVAAISKTGRLRFVITGPSKGNVLLRIAQYEASTEPAASLSLARNFVAGKLQNCRRMLQRWAWDEQSRLSRQVLMREIDAIADRLAALPSAPDGDTVRGLEGDASRRYFKGLGVHLHRESLMTFYRRTRRPPRDPVNSLLSFVYGLQLTEVIGAADAVGLDPQIGFLHSARPGRPSLALDLLEEFRPAVADRFVVSALTRNQITNDDFETGAGDAVYLSDVGRRRVLALYDSFRQQEVPHPLLGRRIPVALLASVQATLLARHLRRDLPVYPPYTIAA